VCPDDETAKQYVKQLVDGHDIELGKATAKSQNSRPMNGMHDLEQMIARLLEAARKLPAGETRHSTLKEIGRFRVRLDAISAQQGQSQTAK
jgi:hypothetical protein